MLNSRRTTLILSMKYKNNPGNLLKKAGSQYFGQLESKHPYCEFSSMELGVRAIAAFVALHKLKYGTTTIRELVTQYVGKRNLDVEEYVDFVSSRLNLDPDYPDIAFTSYLTFRELIASICFMESDYIPSYNDYCAIDVVYIHYLL